GPADKAGLKEQDIIVAVGKTPVKTYDDLLEEIGNHSVGDKVKLSLRNDPKRKVVEVELVERPAFAGGKGGGGGGPFGPGGPKKDRPYHAFYGGQAANKQDEQGPDAHEYGGVYKSSDGGESWTRINSLNPRPMYFSQIRVDPTNDQNVYVLGVQQFKS